MDQYVKVVFPTRRQVRVDDEPCGFTNKVFQVETGTHVFDLGPKDNYKPGQRKCLVDGTLADEPMILEFERIGDE